MIFLKIVLGYLVFMALFIFLNYRFWQFQKAKEETMKRLFPDGQ